MLTSVVFTLFLSSKFLALCSVFSSAHCSFSNFLSEKKTTILSTHVFSFYFHTHVVAPNNAEMSSLTLEAACERFTSVIRNSVWDQLLDKCLGRGMRLPTSSFNSIVMNRLLYPRAGLADRLHITRLEKAHELSARAWETAIAEMGTSASSINDDPQSSNVPTRRSHRKICTSAEEEWDMFIGELEENRSLNDRPSDDEEEEVEGGNRTGKLGDGDRDGE